LHYFYTIHKSSIKSINEKFKPVYLQLILM